MNAVTFLGITDEQTTCDLCGKSNLKRTVRLRFEDDAEECHYGVDCAARALGRTQTFVRNAAENAQSLADREAARRVDFMNRYAAAYDAFGAAREARHAGDDDLARLVENGSPTLLAARGDFNRANPFDSRNGVERFGMNFPQYLARVAVTGTFPEVIEA